MNKRFFGKKKFLRLGAAFLCLAMVFGQASVLSASAGTPSADAASSAYKDTADQAAAEEALKELFTLEDVAKLARSYGAETRQAKADLLTAQAAKEAADMGYYDARYNAAVLPDGTVEAAGSAQEDAVMALDDAKTKVESEMEVSAYNGEVLFFSCLQLQDAVALMEKSVALGQEQVKTEELKVKIGLSTPVELQKKELALAELTDQKQTLSDSLDATRRSLMRQTGREDGLEFRLDGSFSIEGMRTEYEPEQLAEAAVRNNLALNALNRSIDKMADRIDESGLTPSVRGQLGAVRDGMILTRDNLIKTIKLLARSTVTGLETARQEIALLEKKITDKKTAYDTLSLQVSLGLAPKAGLQGAELELLTAESDLLKARQNYYLSLRRASLLIRGVAIMTL